MLLNGLMITLSFTEKQRYLVMITVGFRYKGGYRKIIIKESMICNWLLLKMEKYVWECIIIAKKNGGLENKREKDGIQISITLVDVDFVEYRRKVDNKAVKKNCTIPYWMNVEAEKAGINYSKLLQDAIMSVLGITKSAN